MPCENLFTRFLLQNKAERMQQTQRQFNVRLQASNGSLVVKGEKDAVAQAIAKVEALRAELASRTIEMAVNGAQIDMLLNQKAAVVQALEQEFGCLISVESAKGSMKVVVDEARREETVEAINAKLATVCTERVEIPECLLALFVGPKGSNINAMRQAHDTKAELAKGVLEISGKEENVAAMKKAVEEWLEQHTIAEIPAERQLAREALIGEKGAKIQSLRKELAVEIQIEEGKVVVIGAPENVEKAVATLTQLLDTYRKENAVVAMRHEVFVNAKELRRSEIDAREKEWNVSMSLRHDAVYIHGDEASVAKAKQEIEDIVAKYAEFHEDSLDVPKEEIGVLLGKNGDNLRALESQLGVSVHIEGSKLRIWGPASALPAAKAGIVSNLEERVYLTEELNCTGKQIEFLRAERFEVVHAIQNAYNVTITLPREFPLSGPIKVAVRGNRRQLDEAIPVVREALQGLIRCELHLDGMVHRLLTESSLQFQRLALESRCRIQPDEAAGLVRIVGPKQGVELVQVRVWEQLAALDPSLYRKIDVSEAVLLGLQEKKDAMKTFSKQHGVQLRLLPQAVLVEAPAAAMDEAVAFVQTLADAAAQESLLIPVGQDRVAFVIGAQGARINGIIKQSGAQLRVLRDEWVHVLGTPEQAAKARALLEAALEEYAATHVAFQVDEALVYAIRGPRNSNLVRIERECRVRVRLEQDGAVSIVGNAGEDVANARAALEKLEEEARANPEQETAYRGGEKPRRREREQGAEERKQKKEREAEAEAEAETPAESVWEKLKRAPLLPSKTVGGSDMYKSESGYTVEL
ncbi:uncharacterized protein [Blastocystis hominis]|uniref:K Homology domain-containing protein n=1 Tax=Blastocystis hominis TaxID=12968 RepID=D8MA68_BLAHO|nr:uncharacterized protein [Blastocystis hominis]CBK24957.2 unnamed protein product [Blastocystis hominis]|eukprot:XP_012899005.1 uncharacterized protein [Blastocystis hominis]